MKPLELIVEGFKPFREVQKVDFRGLDFFLIKGPTGSGKSSLLDAIVFALFGNVEDLTSKDLINKNSAKARVRFTFSVGGKTYTVERLIFKSKSTSEIRFYEENRRIGGKTREINSRIEKILGVNRKQFEQIFYLPQGRYDSFLKGDPKERRKVLENLFELEIYRKLAEKIREELKTTWALLEEKRGYLSTLEDISEEKLRELERELKQLERERKRIQTELNKVRRDLQKLERKKEYFDRYKEFYQKLHRLEEDLKRSEQRWNLLKKLENFESEITLLEDKEQNLQGLIEEIDKLTGKMENLERNLESKRKELKTFEGKLKGIKDKYDKAQQLKAYIRSVEDLERNYSEKFSLEKDIEKLKKNIENLSIQLKKLKKELEEKKKEKGKKENLLKALEVNSEEITLLELLKKDMENLKEKLKKRDEKAKKLEELKRKINEELKLLEEKDKKLEELQRNYEKLLEKTFKFKLLEKLKEGDPCPICGRPLKKEHLSVEKPEAQRLKEIKLLLEKLKEERNSVAAKLGNLQGQKTSLKEDLKKLEDEIKSLLSKLKSDYAPLNICFDADLQKLLSEVDRRLKDLKKKSLEREQLQREIEELQTSIENLENKIGEIEKSLTNLEVERKHKEQILKDEVQIISQKISEISEILNKDEEEILKYIAEKMLSKTLKRLIERTENEYTNLIEEINQIRRDINSIETWLEAKKEERKNKIEKKNELVEQIKTLKLRLPEEFRDKTSKELKKLFKEFKDLKEERDNLERERNKVQLSIEEIKKEYPDIEKFDNTKLDGLKEKEGQLKELETETLTGIGSLEAKIKNTKELLKKKEQLIAEFEELRKREVLLKRLEGDFKASEIIDFAIGKKLEEVIGIASEFFLKLSDERYSFEIDNGRIVVFDSLTDDIRSVKTLSGGETFLASLSVALGFGEVLGSNTSVESLFIDEGFGTLDRDRLAKIEEIFEAIRGHIGKTVGVISHLEELSLFFENRIEVIPSADGSRVEVIREG